MDNRKVLIYSEAKSAYDLVGSLESQGWQVAVAESAETTKALLEQYSFNVAIAFIENHNETNFLLRLEDILSRDTLINWVMVLPSELNAKLKENLPIYSLINKYCYDFQSQPLKNECLLTILGHAYGMAAIARNPKDLSSQDSAKYGIIGKSPKMCKLFERIGKVSRENCSVLISGETGTGKELIANAIHYHSQRKDKPLIAVNCGAFAESLVQAELFGYEKGAFTGATRSKIGRIEAAQGGTLFLDEIGDLPLAQQVNLLRFLEQKTILRIGGDKEIPVDVRIIAATHVDLNEKVATGEFREDLFYRLRVLHLNVPPLREREADIELLGQFFFQRFSENRRNSAKGFSLAALQVMRNHDWKGNVRELANSVLNAVIMSDNRLLSPTDLNLDQRSSSRREIETLEASRAETDRACILASLRLSNNNITKAAELLEISRVTLHRLMDKYQLNLKARHHG